MWQFEVNDILLLQITELQGFKTFHRIRIKALASTRLRRCAAAASGNAKAQCMIFMPSSVITKGSN